ncbi:hypothetical protein [Methanococcoides alaskense]|uniref:Uncharacterized protein n=1 Tax=Methanococcoides alaskense TaxID=325778 RepID=A0AA90TYH1_9EURY|nr:hypothetical protein [Methanococcoides alaskense]MDA0525592.1 hypothetical protein [Methanococcoides alaskense]MDR6222374.1 hypothetical protein [Methanococcoides alaskense]
MKNEDFSWKNHELKEYDNFGNIVTIPAFEATEIPEKGLPIHKEQPMEDTMINDFKERISMMLSDRRCKKE